MLRAVALLVCCCSTGVLPAAPIPKADPKTTWVGKQVIVKVTGTNMRVPNDNGTFTELYVNIINPTVVGETKDTIDINIGGRTGTLDKSAVVRPEDGVEYFSEKILAKPSVDLYVRRASAYKIMKNYDEALADYNSALGMNRSAQLLQNRGTLYLARHEYSLALADFNACIELSPDYQFGYRSRGTVYEQTQRYDEAIKDYEKANEIEPDATVWAGIGQCYSSKDDYKTAIGKFEKALELNPKSTTAFVGRGHAYLELHDHDKAMNDFDEAVALAPLVPYGYTSRASANLKLGHYKKASTDSLEALRLDGESAAALNSRAWFLAVCPDAEYRDGKRAVELATKACKFSEWRSSAHLDTLAAAYAETGDFDNAVKFVKQALEAPEQLKKDAEESKARLKLFEDRKPYREPIKAKK